MSIAWKKIIHLDVKPKNIFIDSNNNAKLSEIGLGREINNLASTEYGKPFYLPLKIINTFIMKNVIYSH